MIPFETAITLPSLSVTTEVMRTPYFQEESSSKLLDSVVKADNRFIESSFNRIILPALASIGVLKPGLRLVIAKEVDVEKLWKMVHEGSQYYDFDIDWIRETFGIEVTG